MYMKFAFGWCASGCESVEAILEIGGVSKDYVSHHVMLLLRIFMVVGCLCEV